MRRTLLLLLLGALAGAAALPANGDGSTMDGLAALGDKVLGKGGGLLLEAFKGCVEKPKRDSVWKGCRLHGKEKTAGCVLRAVLGDEQGAAWEKRVFKGAAGAVEAGINFCETGKATITRRGTVKLRPDERSPLGRVFRAANWPNGVEVAAELEFKADVETGKANAESARLALKIEAGQIPDETAKMLQIETARIVVDGARHALSGDKTPPAVAVKIHLEGRASLSFPGGKPARVILSGDYASGQTGADGKAAPRTLKLRTTTTPANFHALGFNLARALQLAVAWDIDLDSRKHKSLFCAAAWRDGTKMGLLKGTRVQDCADAAAANPEKRETFVVGRSASGDCHVFSLDVDADSSQRRLARLVSPGKSESVGRAELGKYLEAAAARVVFTTCPAMSLEDAAAEGSPYHGLPLPPALPPGVDGVDGPAFQRSLRQGFNFFGTARLGELFKPLASRAGGAEAVVQFDAHHPYAAGFDKHVRMPKDADAGFRLYVTLAGQKDAAKAVDAVAGGGGKAAPLVSQIFSSVSADKPVVLLLELNRGGRAASAHGTSPSTALPPAPAAAATTTTTTTTTATSGDKPAPKPAVTPTPAAGDAAGTGSLLETGESLAAYEVVARVAVPEARVTVSKAVQPWLRRLADAFQSFGWRRPESQTLVGSADIVVPFRSSAGKTLLAHLEGMHARVSLQDLVKAAPAGGGANGAVKAPDGVWFGGADAFMAVTVEAAKRGGATEAKGGRFHANIGVGGTLSATLWGRRADFAAEGTVLGSGEVVMKAATRQRWRHALGVDGLEADVQLGWTRDADKKDALLVCGEMVTGAQKTGAHSTTGPLGDLSLADFGAGPSPKAPRALRPSDCPAGGAARLVGISDGKCSTFSALATPELVSLALGKTLAPRFNAYVALDDSQLVLTNCNEDRALSALPAGLVTPPKDGLERTVKHGVNVFGHAGVGPRLKALGDRMFPGKDADGGVVTDDTRFDLYLDAHVSRSPRAFDAGLRATLEVTDLNDAIARVAGQDAPELQRVLSAHVKTGDKPKLSLTLLVDERGQKPKEGEAPVPENRVTLSGDMEVASRDGIVRRVSRALKPLGVAEPGASAIVAKVDIDFPFKRGVSPPRVDAANVRAKISLAALALPSTGAKKSSRLVEFSAADAYAVVAGGAGAAKADAQVGGSLVLDVWGNRVTTAVTGEVKADGSASLASEVSSRWDRSFGIAGLRSSFKVGWSRGAKDTKDQTLTLCGVLEMPKAGAGGAGGAGAADDDDKELTVDEALVPRPVDATSCKFKPTQTGVARLFGVAHRLESEANRCLAASVEVDGSGASHILQHFDVSGRVDRAVRQFVRLDRGTVAWSTCKTLGADSLPGVVPTVKGFIRKVRHGLNAYAEAELGPKLSHVGKLLATAKESGAADSVPGREERFKGHVIYADLAVDVPPAEPSVYAKVMFPVHWQLCRHKRRDKGCADTSKTVFELVGFEVGVDAKLGEKTDVCVDGAMRMGLRVPNSAGEAPDALALYGEGKFCASADAGGFSVEVLAGMTGEWHSPLGIKWLTLGHVGGGFRLTAEAAAAQEGVPLESVKVFGRTQIGKVLLDLKADVSIVNPKQLALEGELKNLDVSEVFRWLLHSLEKVDRAVVREISDRLASSPDRKLGGIARSPGAEVPAETMPWHERFGAAASADEARSIDQKRLVMTPCYEYPEVARAACAAKRYPKEPADLSAKARERGADRPASVPTAEETDDQLDGTDGAADAAGDGDDEDKMLGDLVLKDVYARFAPTSDVDLGGGVTIAKGIEFRADVDAWGVELDAAARMAALKGGLHLDLSLDNEKGSGLDRLALRINEFVHAAGRWLHKLTSLWHRQRASPHLIRASRVMSSSKLLFPDGHVVPDNVAKLNSVSVAHRMAMLKAMVAKQQEGDVVVVDTWTMGFMPRPGSSVQQVYARAAVRLHSQRGWLERMNSHFESDVSYLHTSFAMRSMNAGFPFVLRPHGRDDKLDVKLQHVYDGGKPRDVWSCTTPLADISALFDGEKGVHYLWQGADCRLHKTAPANIHTFIKIRYHSVPTQLDTSQNLFRLNSLKVKNLVLPFLQGKAEVSFDLDLLGVRLAEDFHLDYTEVFKKFKTLLGHIDWSAILDKAEDLVKKELVHVGLRIEQVAKKTGSTFHKMFGWFEKHL